MKSPYGNVVLLTGASSGIGKSLAEYLSQNGFHVYGTSRHVHNFEDDLNIIPGSYDGFIKMIQLDVCSDESVKRAVDYVLKREGKIDILVNNAGFGIAGSVEDTSIEEAKKQFDTNFFGILRVSRYVIPFMRQRKNGLILNTSSVAGYISIPFQSMYSASKYAVESVTESMRIELKPFGIKVSMVEPGDTKTGFTEKREFVEASKDSIYKEKFTKSVNAMIKSETNGPDPHIVVNSMVRVIKSSNPPIRITAGVSYKIIAFLKRIVPSRFLEFVVSKIY